MTDRELIESLVDAYDDKVELTQEEDDFFGTISFKFYNHDWTLFYQDRARARELLEKLGHGRAASQEAGL